MHSPHYYFIVNGPNCQLCGLTQSQGLHLSDGDDTPAPAPEPRTFLAEHDYVSTACQHRLHEQCRRTCKFCTTQCLCVCHRWQIPV